MNIKSLVRNIQPPEIERAKAPGTRAIKAETSTDRDANGQQSNPQPEKRKLNDEEIQAALEQIKEIPGIKNNNLVVKLVEENQTRLVLIEDSNGRVIRRIPESDLSQLLANRKKDKGQLFDRAM